MKNAIILHGMEESKADYLRLLENEPSPTKIQWYPWLQKELIKRGIQTVCPEMPNPYPPMDYSQWVKTFEANKIGPDTILVGHSAGGGFLVRWLSEHPKVTVGKVVLVAPWTNPDHDFETGNFFNFEIDKKFIRRTEGITIFLSDDDTPDIKHTVDIIRESVPGTELKQFHGYGHFVEQDMKSKEFPELLEECLRV